MSRPSISTPCPAPSRASAHRLSALPSFDEQDDTSQIEYTRVIQREFAHARPRRPARRDAGPRVFEDVVEGEEMRTFQKKDESAPRGTLLGKRPSRRVPMASMAQGKSNMAPAETSQEHDHGAPAGKDGIARLDDDKARKDSRRRTIYVPTDDTTLMTIHPGANTTNRLDDTFQLPAYKPQSLVECASRSPPVTDQPQQRLPTKKPRLSLAAAPRRAPLGQIEAKSLNLPAVDVVGDGGGKENTPPKFEAMEKPLGKDTSLKGSEQAKQQLAKSRLFEPTAASQSRQTMQSRKSVPMTKARPSPNVSSAVNAARSRLIEARGTSKSVVNRATERPNKESPPTRKPLPPKPWKTKTNFVTAADVSKAKLQRYHALNEDVSRPDLYEENWLDQQEVALTEVINHIFSSAEPSTFDECMGKPSLRESLLELYDQPHVVTIHKRLQASLCYGALSKPKDMPTAPDLTHDLGLRRRFLQLWLESYKMEVLCAAAEVVVGRKIPTSESMSGHAGSPGSDTKSIDPKHSRREIIGFLETFFVTVEDVEEARSTDEEVQTQRRNKTVLRSLMLVWLLDQAATSGLHSERLFKVKSAHKTSASVLNALAGMLVPSIGDMGRVMRHMEFIVSYVQDPLDEVSYHIDNLAVDLRDGILLTKLVELLLYQTSSKLWDRLDSADETLTIVMPDATVLESALYNNDGSQQSRILSQHLKMPCIGHAQKVYNVDIALQALDSHPRTSQAVASSITAETIVDGHRENTLNLLWSLVSSIGLDVLLSKEDLIEDISRLNPTTPDLLNLTTDTLLQEWAAAYCAPNGVKVSNLTTSFATDAPYSAIVAAFSDFFSPSDARASLGDTSTACRLRSLGCSEAFVKQLTSSTTSIPTRQTTLANLAFLASRLLPLAKRFHAAVTIQRAFHIRRGWTILRQRVALMKMAAGCAEVVRERHQFVNATLLVQRTWRNIVQGRVTRLDNDVLSFQCLARAWMERRRIVASKRSGLGPGRRMVGW